MTTTAPQIPAADIARDLQFAIFAAREAGKRLLGLRAEERWKDEMLGDVGDQAADGFLRGLLEGRYPDDGVLSEETADSPERLSKDRVWIVDPLDGTKEYRGLRNDWAVHVALTQAGRCVLGAVALPADDQVLWGVCAPGHERAGIEGNDQALVRGDTPSPEQPRLVCSRSHTPEWMETFARAMGAGDFLRRGSVGYKVSRLALGEADYYSHKRGLKEWDTCAPECVARALGWSVTKLRGDDHVYNAPNPKNHELLICRPALRERALAALAESGALAD